MKLRRCAQLLRHMGPRWVGYRVGYALQQKLGVVRRRSPLRAWGDVPLESLMRQATDAAPQQVYQRIRESGQFFFSVSDRPVLGPMLCAFDTAEWTAERLEELQAGKLRYFSGKPVACGWPPRWHRTKEGAEAPANVHFSRLHEFGYGDIKCLWEPARFAFAFDLVRIYWRTGNDQAPRLFWEAVESFRAHNRPNAGLHWNCGQEASFRAFAWCFGLWGLLDHPESTPQRVRDLVQMLAVTAQRVETNIGYALSQQNNHGISEAAGLFTIGLLFPELRDAARWEALGRRLLERQARELIYEDGGFSQYSANYHRVMLHDHLWAIRLAEKSGRPLSGELRERVVRAGQFLLDVQDRATGRVPRFGHDDGALVLPLSNNNYEDYRPVVQAVAALGQDPLPHVAGPHDEALLWLFGPAALQRPRAAPPCGDRSAPAGGYELLRRDDSFAFIRCGRFRHRPSQADLLHTDIWWRGHNIALDPGTYSYNAEGLWAGMPLATTAVHNTVGVDGADQMERASRFLYLPWPDSTVVHRSRAASGGVAWVEIRHEGYRRLADPVLHERAVVQIGEEHWVVLDRLYGRVEHDWRLHWLLADWPAELDQAAGRLELKVEAANYGVQVLASVDLRLSLVRADPKSARGWYAPRYQQLAPALSLAAESRSASVWFATILGPGRWGSALDPERLTVEAEGFGTVTMELGGETVIKRIRRESADGTEILAG
jgi:hypothetical protein